MRVLISFIDDITASIVQYSNRLQASWLRYFPQVLNAFSQVSTKTLSPFPESLSHTSGGGRIEPT